MIIGLTYDLRDDYLAQGFTEEQVAEFDSVATISAIEGALQSLGYDTERIGNGMALAKQLACGKRWDLVFNIAEGLYGRSREAQVPCLLEMFGIPYTFSDPLVCALTLDKAMTKRVVASAGLYTPRFAVVTSPADVDALQLEYPLFAKPLAEGTGKGVDKDSRVESPAALKKVCTRLLERFAEPVLVEEYLPGREFTTAVLGTGREARIVGTMEFSIRPNAPAQDTRMRSRRPASSAWTTSPCPKATSAIRWKPWLWGPSVCSSAATPGASISAWTPKVVRRSSRSMCFQACTRPTRISR